MTENEILNLLVNTPEYVECIENDDFISLRERLRYKGQYWPEIVTYLVNEMDMDVLECKHNGKLINEIPENFFAYSNIKRISIPSNIKIIGDFAFSECSSLTSVKIPDSITTIGNYTFSDCISLANIYILDNVETIGDYAFKGCNKLAIVNISNGTSIGRNAFVSCRNLTSIDLRQTYTVIY